MRFLIRGALLCLLTTVVDAHTVDAVPAGGWRWSFSPWVVFCVAGSGLLYATGYFNLWRQGGPRRSAFKLRTAAFVAGWLSVAVALMSPLHAAGARSFSLHMVQHEILIVVAAPLLVAAGPWTIILRALPPDRRHHLKSLFRDRAWRRLRSGWAFPLLAWLGHAAVLWLWHLPPFFDRALQNESIHNIEHLSFFLSALMFWSVAIGPRARHRQGLVLLFLFTTMIHSGALGALLALAHRPWYRAYLESDSTAVLTPLVDQQLGGLIMWMPAGFVYVLAAMALMARWTLMPRALAAMHRS